MAACFQVTRGRMAAKQPHALRAGARVSATLVVVTGPKSHVTGASTTPTSVPEVFDSRLAPSGTFTEPEKNRLCRWVMAQAGQAVNQTCCAGSPQAHVNVDDGCPDQTCHHSATAGRAKQTMATTWNPTARAARSAPLSWAGAAGRGRSSGSGASASASARWSPRGKSSGSTDVPAMSCVGCVDTAFPTVTGAERTARPSRPGAETAAVPFL